MVKNTTNNAAKIVRNNAAIHAVKALSIVIASTTFAVFATTFIMNRVNGNEKALQKLRANKEYTKLVNSVDSLNAKGTYSKQQWVDIGKISDTLKTEMETCLSILQKCKENDYSDDKELLGIYTHVDKAKDCVQNLKKVGITVDTQLEAISQLQKEIANANDENYKNKQLNK